MTAEWMLTDEEIEDIENEYPRKYGIGITATKAQAKKLLEYLIRKTVLGTGWIGTKEFESMLKQLEAK